MLAEIPTCSRNCMLSNCLWRIVLYFVQCCWIWESGRWFLFCWRNYSLILFGDFMWNPTSIIFTLKDGGEIEDGGRYVAWKVKYIIFDCDWLSNHTFWLLPKRSQYLIWPVWSPHAETVNYFTSSFRIVIYPGHWFQVEVEEWHKHEWWFEYHYVNSLCSEVSFPGCVKSWAWLSYLQMFHHHHLSCFLIAHLMTWRKYLPQLMDHSFLEVNGIFHFF